MALDREILEELEHAVGVAKRWEDIRAHLQSVDPEGGDQRFRPFYFAFSYPLIEPGSSRRERAGGPFGAMIAGEGWRFPPAVADVEDSDVEAWAEAFDALEDPVVRARLGDLLWERRSEPRPDLRARAACDALLVLAQREDWPLMERSRCLSRALELARAVGDDSRRELVARSMAEFVERVLASEERGPGAALAQLRQLVDLPVEVRPRGVDDLLLRTGERFGDDPFIADEVAVLRSRLADPSRQDEIRREQVERWRQEAGRGDAMLQVFRLEHALELARDYGLTEQAEELRQELGQIGPEELDLKRISAEIEFSDEEIREFLALFREASSWQEALVRLAAEPPPGGSPEELEARVQEMMADFPIQYLFSKSVIGPESAGAIFHANDPDSHQRLALSEEHARATQIWAIFAADALDAIGEAFDRPSHAALTEFFESDLVHREVAERMARALELYWDGQPDESAHLLVPRLERVFRELARRVGVPVYREPSGDKPGGVAGLGTVLQDLKGAFKDKGRHAYLAALLTDPLGLNLRNLISHGLIGRVGRHNAALLLQVACLLPSLELGEPDEPPEPPPGAAPASG
jgi:hypothetical protein